MNTEESCTIPDLRQSSVHTSRQHRSSNASLRTLGSAIFAVAVILSWLGTATAQVGRSNLERHKAELEIQKLELEVAELKKPNWLTNVLAFLAGIVSAAVTVWATRRARRGALDQSVHDKRLQVYPELVNATAGLAVYFPPGDPPAPIDPEECGAMGRAMSEWYFERGGLLLSVKARIAYFRLARAVTRASLAEALKVPTFPKDARDISVEKLEKYREELARDLDLDDVENWSFGGPGSEETPARRFKDYIFLQRLSSELRSRLSEDLRSRHRPS